MASIRKSGGVVAFHWQGKLLDPQDQAFADALATRRFRTIEHAASEEISCGWVTAVDPTGNSFDLEDLDGGAGTWLRFRMDKKKLPTKWLQIHRDAAEKERGKRLSARERRELKDDLADKLLPRVLPTIQLIDALLFHDKQLVLLFATSTGAREAFTKLFFETFTVPLDRADPLQRGRLLGLGADAERALEQAEPVRWPDSTRADGTRPDGSRRPAPRASAATPDEAEADA
ncbi:MAG: recombination-associated protein RdgC [Planctomycetes bacterium]|nr:recombination-associated protein RdgC [Planctomycetota bacterium]